MSSRCVLAAIAIVVLAACSGGATGYGADTQGAFMESCAVKQQQPESVCRCTYQQITQRIPFDHYVELDKELQKDPKTVPDELLRIVSDCGSQSSQSNQSGQPNQSNQSSNSNSTSGNTSGSTSSDASSDASR